MENNTLIFKTSDGGEFKAPLEITNMLIYTAKDSIKSFDLNLILQYCEHHKCIPPPEIIKPLQFNDLKLCVSDTWDAEFISSIEFDKVTDLLLAADYLKCNSLMDLCYARMALYFRVQELKKAFLLTETEFTEQEIKEIKDGNSWLMTLTEDRLKELDNC